MTNERRHNSISGAPPSPSSTSVKVPLENAGKSSSSKGQGTDVVAAGLAQRVADLEKRLEVEVGELEKRVVQLEEEKTVAEEKMKAMRDTIEEVSWARKRLEDRMKEQEEVVKKQTEYIKKQEEEVMKQLNEERKARKESEEKVAVERSGLAKELGEIKKGIAALVEKERTSDGGQKVVIFADSNGKDSTADEIKDHIVREERANYDIVVVPAFHVEDAYKMVTKHQVNVSGAIVVVDCLTNDVRGTKKKSPLEPEELVRQIHLLREATCWANAKETVICQVKPMQHVDVTHHNKLLHEYLCKQGVTGCQTMICMEFLGRDGFHIMPQFKSVLHRQFACALLGVPVPCPTPYQNFISGHIRRAFDQNWPNLMGSSTEGSNSHHGWN